MIQNSLAGNNWKSLYFVILLSSEYSVSYVTLIVYARQVYAHKLSYDLITYKNYGYWLLCEYTWKLKPTILKINLTFIQFILNVTFTSFD